MIRRLLLILLLASPCWATAPTLSAHAEVAATTAASATSSSVSWASGDLIVVGAADEGAGVESFSAVPTATGLTFASVITHAASSNCAMSIFTATAGSSGSGGITLAAAASGKNFNFEVWVWHNHGGVGNHSSQFTTTKTVSLTPAGGADSAIIWEVGDFAGTTAPTASPTSPNETTRQAAGIVAYSYLSADITDQTSAGAVSYGVTTTTAGPWSIGVLEIKGTSTAGPNVGFNGKVGFVGKVGIL